MNLDTLPVATILGLAEQYIRLLIGEDAHVDNIFVADTGDVIVVTTYQSPISHHTPYTHAWTFHKTGEVTMENLVQSKEYV